MWGWFRRKSPKDIINQTKKIKISGIIFEIKKISPIDFAEGTTAMHQIYQTYSADPRNVNVKKTSEKIKKYYRDVFMAGVVDPKLTRKQDEAVGDVIFVDNLFTEWSVAETLLAAILDYTYSKKK